MRQKPHITAIIPARYASSRFPGKPLARIAGIPMILRVQANVSQAALVDDVIIATDDQRIEALCGEHHINVFRSIETHQSGTDRIAEVLRISGSSTDVVVNVQGDEPLLPADDIDRVLKPFCETHAEKLTVTTLVRRLIEPERINDPNVVKTVLDKDGFALYFSRYPIPACFHEGRITNTPHECTSEETTYYQHIGIYAYRKEVLLAFTELPKSMLEAAEKLEQLRLLENGYRIRCVETDSVLIGVDTPEDVTRVERTLALRGDTHC